MTRASAGRLLLTALGVALTTTLAMAQQRRANMTGNRNDGRGKCTLEIVVDGAVDIEISGDSATLRNQSGQRPQWRRFECTGPMPNNPANFRFSGVDGRGRQELLRDPRNGGPAVIRIEDPNGGSEGYTFDITWDEGRGGAPYNQGGGFPSQNNPGQYGNRNLTAAQAVSACQQSVAQQASQRFNGARVEFRTTSIDDQPGRNDWVVGTLMVRNESYRFSCSVNFDNGQIRSAEIEPRQSDGRPMDDRRRYASRREVQACEREVMERLRRDRYSDIEITWAESSNDNWQGEKVTGTLQARRGDRTQSLRFSCSVNPGNMTVRSVDIRRQSR